MDPYIGEIRLFGFNFPTVGWQLCAGQILSIQQFSTLFALLGAQYGGNGTTTFALPNLCGRAPTSQGTGPGLTPVVVGEQSGTETVTLLNMQMPFHNHTLNAYVQGTNRLTAPASGASLGSTTRASSFQNGTPPIDSMMAPQTLSPVGANLPHENRQPFLVLNYCIATEGVFPSFS
ncbi:MAG: tail fiber protein [Luteibacter sp.]